MKESSAYLKTENQSDFQLSFFDLKADGTWQCIEQIRIGDRLALGGRVTGRMEFEANPGDLYRYPVKENNNSGDMEAISCQVTVSGRQAVWEESRWLRVGSSTKAQQIDGDTFQSLLSQGEQSVRVFDVDVERHLLLVLPGIHKAGQCYMVGHGSLFC